MAPGVFPRAATMQPTRPLPLGGRAPSKTPALSSHWTAPPAPRTRPAAPAKQVRPTPATQVRPTRGASAPATTAVRSVWRPASSVSLVRAGANRFRPLGWSAPPPMREPLLPRTQHRPHRPLLPRTPHRHRRLPLLLQSMPGPPSATVLVQARETPRCLAPPRSSRGALPRMTLTATSTSK
jgi:hypothetical protein